MIDTSPAALRKLADIRHYLNEAHQFAAMSPRGKENIESALEILDELDAIAAEKEAQAKQEPIAYVPKDVIDQLKPPMLVLRNVPLITYEAEDHVPLYLAPQHHPEQHLEMVSPAEVPQTKLAPHTYSKDMKPPIHEQPPNPEWKMEDPARFAAPADVPLPEPTLFFTENLGLGHVARYEGFTAEQMHQYAEAYAKAAVAAVYEQCIGEVAALYEQIKSIAGKPPASYDIGRLAALDIAEQRLEAIKANQKGMV